MKSIILYSSALCNLRCRYCYISKNSAMLDIDKELKDSFIQQGYYLNLLKTYLTESEIQEIEKVEVWGGETLLEIERIFPFLEELIPLTPNFKEFFLSSNFCHQRVIPSLQSLSNFFSQFQDKKIKISIQISCDGPQEITDTNRGEGVTAAILQNIDYLLQEQNQICNKNNLSFQFSIKPTLDQYSFVRLLDYNYNIEYYSFFENKLLTPLNKVKQPFPVHPPIPNLAIPTEYTQEHGLILRDIVKLQRQIELDNKEKKFFTNYKTITLYSNRLRFNNELCLNYCAHSPFCGTGTVSIGLLPNNLVCGCHRCFAEYFENYNLLYASAVKDSSIYIPQNTSNLSHLIFKTPLEWENYKKIMSAYTKYNSTTFVSTNANQLMLLSNCGLVEEKYQNLTDAILAVKQIMILAGACAGDNLVLTQLIASYPNYQFKLFCNGALNYIFQEG